MKNYLRPRFFLSHPWHRFTGFFLWVQYFNSSSDRSCACNERAVSATYKPARLDYNTAMRWQRTVRARRTKDTDCAKTADDL